MVNQGIIKTKINQIETNLQRLEEKQNVMLEEFKRNLDIRDIILHNLQQAIQGCLDLASHIISDEGWPVPDTFAGLFDILSEHKVISEELVENFKNMAGLRNIIVHRYSSIDLERVHAILAQDIKDIRVFLKEVCIFAKI